MNIFISWSNTLSKEVGLLLRDWLPYIFHEVQPWMSAEDIRVGSRWGHELSEVLGSCNFGVICLTPENLHSVWIHYEAGSLSRYIKNSLVVPYLVGVGPHDLKGPLQQFQAVNSTKEGTLKLIRVINKEYVVNKIPDNRLLKNFEKWWPELNNDLLQVKEKILSLPIPQTKPFAFQTSEFQFFRTRAKNQRRGSVILNDGKENDIAYIILRSGQFTNKFEDFANNIYHFSKKKGTQVIVIVPNAQNFLDSLGGALEKWITELYENIDCQNVRALVLEQNPLDSSLPTRNEGYFFITDGVNLENDEGFRSLSNVSANFLIGYVKSLIRAGRRVQINNRNSI